MLKTIPKHKDRYRLLYSWLALLLIRVIETTTGDTWTTVRGELERLHVGTFTGPAGTLRHRTEITTVQRHILTKLDMPHPAKIIELQTPTG